MTTFKNKNFKKRDYEATNVIFCKSEKAPNENWIECNESEITDMKCSPLWVDGDIRYFGYI